MSKSAVARELWALLSANKKYWLLPIVVLLLALGTLVVVAGGSVLAPFVYTLF